MPSCESSPRDAFEKSTVACSEDNSTVKDKSPVSEPASGPAVSLTVPPPAAPRAEADLEAAAGAQAAPEAPAKAKEAAPRRVEMPHIQGLRVLAMVWIVGFHFIYREPGTLLHVFIEHRPLDMFTVISGFATHLAYGRRKDLGKPLAFLLKRSAKILFMYYLALVVSTLIRLGQMVGGVTANSGEEYLKLGGAFLLALPMLNLWLFDLLMLTTPSRWQPWPPNGPLWYVQILIFCWLLYPLLRDCLCKGSRRRVLVVTAVLGILRGVPVKLLSDIFAEKNPDMHLLLKMCPPLMLPAYFLGVTACELYQQQMEKVKEPGGFEKDWASLTGEMLLLAFVLFQLYDYGGGGMALFAPLFGGVLYMWGVASARGVKEGWRQCGLKWLLSHRWVGKLGDASFVAFTMQEPMAELFYWVCHPSEFGRPMNHNGNTWMALWQFAIYIVLLYAFSLQFGSRVNAPASKWILEKLLGKPPAKASKPAGEAAAAS